MSNHRLLPCTCAREWLAAMIEEVLRQKPADAGPAWLVSRLLRESNMSIREQDGVIAELVKVKS
jgi:hypothetical protein